MKSIKLKKIWKNRECGKYRKTWKYESYRKSENIER